MADIQWSEKRQGDAVSQKIEALKGTNASIFFPNDIYPCYALFFEREPGKDFDTLDEAKARARQMKSGDVASYRDRDGD